MLRCAYKKFILVVAMMFDLFYTLFKYKEKAQKDELGYYPEKVNVRAFPERRYLWTSRFFVIVSCISLCLNIILSGTIILLIPLKKVDVMPLRLDDVRYQVVTMGKAEDIEFAGNLVTEGQVEKYVIQRYTIEDNFDEFNRRTGEGEFLHLASDDIVYKNFEEKELPYFTALHKQGIRRKIDIQQIYPVSFDFWQARFATIDTIPNEEEPMIKYWIATIRMYFNFSKYEDKDQGLKNPFGLTVTEFDLSYLGSNIKSTRK